MKLRLTPFALFILAMIFASCASSPSRDGNTTILNKFDGIALFPITGGTLEDGEAIISSLARQRVIGNAFEKIIPLTRSSIRALNFEREFQQYSYLTDKDTIFEIGRDLQAAYVIAGSLSQLGNQNLIILSIMDVESLQQIAGVYRPYNAVSDINSMISDIASSLVAAISQNSSDLPGLSVPPFDISSGVNNNDAMVLAQVLSCELSNSGRFAVLPRTDSIQTVMYEHQRQRRGDINQERLRRLGVGHNPKYVLDGKVERLGDLTKLAVDILDIEDTSWVDGAERDYNDLSQGIVLVQEIAALISGRMTEADIRRIDEQRQREAAVSARQQARESAAASMRREVYWFFDDRKDFMDRLDFEWEALSIYYHRTTNEEVELSGFSGSTAVRFFPIPFTSIGFGARAGGARARFIQQSSGYWSGKLFDNLVWNHSISPTVGLRFPLSIKNEPQVILFGDFVADLSYIGWWEERLTSGFAPGFETGLSFLWYGYSDGLGFNIKYRGNWYNSSYTSDGKLYMHGVSIGLLMPMGW